MFLSQSLRDLLQQRQLILIDKRLNKGRCDKKAHKIIGNFLKNKYMLDYVIFEDDIEKAHQVHQLCCSYSSNVLLFMHGE